MNEKNKKAFKDYLDTTENRILVYLENSRKMQGYFEPTDIGNGSWSYIPRRSKRLRPSVLLMACGCFGGEEREQLAVPAAAGVELFHTWTLVHDDLIDNDPTRRRGPTVHVAAGEKSPNPKRAKEYGRDIAILTGDRQHGWSVTCFLDCAIKCDVAPEVIIRIVNQLQSQVLGQLIEGETLDVQFGMEDWDKALKLSEEEIERMLWLKTGVLYEFAGWAGALIGRNENCDGDKKVAAIKNFTSNCGTAFQLQDDILGIIGNEQETGKPVGADIREGKKTVIVHEALKNANDEQREVIRRTFEKGKDATDEEVYRVRFLFEELNGIKRTQERAAEYIKKAMQEFENIPQNRFSELLKSWAEFMIDRNH